MPIIAGWLEILDDPIYDTAELGPENPWAYLFQAPVGTQHKTYADTNQYQSGVLPAPQKHRIERISAALIRGNRLIPLSDPAWTSIVITLSINCKVYWMGPLWMVAHPHVAMLGGRVSRRLAKWLLRLSSGKLREPIPIEQQQPFMVRAEAYRQLRQLVSVFVALEGLRSRAVM